MTKTEVEMETQRDHLSERGGKIDVTNFVSRLDERHRHIRTRGKSAGNCFDM